MGRLSEIDTCILCSATLDTDGQCPTAACPADRPMQKPAAIVHATAPSSGATAP